MFRSHHLQTVCNLRESFHSEAKGLPRFATSLRSSTNLNAPRPSPETMEILNRRENAEDPAVAILRRLRLAS